MTRTRLYLLGKPRFERGKEPVELTSVKAIALLGYLAASDAPVARERILDLFWPSSAPDAARKNLRNTLWAIRKVLGNEAIDGDENLALDNTLWIDIREFRAHPDPELYGGLFLDGIALDDAPDFEIWLTAERERLTQMYLHTLGTLIADAQAVSDWPRVVKLANRALAQDNLQEPIYRALMLAHAHLGDRVQAVRVYDTLRGILEKELGVTPLAETDAVRDAILRGDYERTSTPQPVHVAPPPTPTRVPFIGRQKELGQLDAELGQASEGHARIVVVDGELGIGKSRLWEEWSRTLAHPITRLDTRCLESTQALPLAPLTELLRRADIAKQLFTKKSPLAPIWITELARLSPDLCEQLSTLPVSSSNLPPDEQRRRLFEALARAFNALQPHSLVFFIDDIQWADTTTLDWFDYVTHRLANQAILVVAALRPGDAPSAVVNLLARWTREGLVQRIHLARLSDDESSALASALGVNTAMTARLQKESDGNPYFLIELIRALPSEDVPPVLTELVRARLNRFPDTARQVLQAVAVLEPDYDFATLRRTSGRDEEETLDALDVLLNSGVLVERDEQYMFSHPLVGEIVRGELSGARRAFLHRRAAQALEIAYAGRLATVAGRIAAHYSQSHETLRAAYFATMAAEHALALAAPAQAVAFYRQALALEPTPERYYGLGRALFRQGELTQAREQFQTALDAFERSGDARASARAALQIAETYFPSGRFEEGNRWIETSIAHLGNEADPESHALAHLLRGQALAQSGVVDESEKNLREAVKHALDHRLPSIAARAAFALGNLLAERGDLDAAIAAYRQTAQSAEQAGDDFQQVLALNNLAYHSLLAGDRAAAHADIDAALALAEQHALRVPLQHLYSTQGEIALAEENWDEAERWIERGIAEAERNENKREIANFQANRARAAQGKGDLDNALGWLESARETAASVNDRHLGIKIALLMAELYAARGERAAAIESLELAEEQLKARPRRLLKEWAERLRHQLVSIPRANS